MPIYDYACSACGHVTEVIHGINDAGPRFCPNCGAEGSMKKALSPPAIVFKGSGWAKVDRRGSSSKTAGSGSGSTAAKGSEGAGSSGDDAGTSKAGDSTGSSPESGTGSASGSRSSGSGGSSGSSSSGATGGDD